MAISCALELGLAHRAWVIGGNGVVQFREGDAELYSETKYGELKVDASGSGK